MGIDCGGLVVLAYSDCGIELGDIEGYTRHPWRDGLVKALGASLKVVDGPIVPGDVLLFRITKEPQHIALATDKGMIHAHLGDNGVVEHGIDNYWKDRFIRAYRL